MSAIPHSVCEQPPAVRAHDERHRTARRDELLEQPHGVRRARRAGDRHDDRQRPLHRKSTRPASTKPKKVRLITPFIVKKAASSRERSPGRTSECSYSSSAGDRDDAGEVQSAEAGAERPPPRAPRRPAHAARAPPRSPAPRRSPPGSSAARARGRSRCPAARRGCRSRRPSSSPPPRARRAPTRVGSTPPSPRGSRPPARCRARARARDGRAA